MIDREDGDKAPFLSCRGICHSYQGKDVLSELDLSIQEGEFVTLVGPSGCGKSTLLRLIIGQEQVSSGEIILCGQPIGPPNPQRGVVFQNYSLFPHLTVLENVILSKKLGLSRWAWRNLRREVEEEGRDMLQMVKMMDHAKKYPHQLSGGQRQRVAIAQTLLQKPTILCMDEPFSALDPKTRESLQLFLKEIWKDYKMTILFVTHDLEEALILGTRLVSLGVNQSSATNGSEVLIDRDISDPCIQATLDAERRNKLRGIPEEIRRLATDPNMDDGV